MKKVLYLILGLLFFLLTSFSFANTKAPGVNCIGLPGCPDEKIEKPASSTIKGNFEDNIVGKFAVDFVITFMKYVAVIAVISLMFGGIMYILSGGEEEKIKKAKSWIIWSLVGVFVSISAWGIISFISKLKINLTL